MPNFSCNSMPRINYKCVLLITTLTTYQKNCQVALKSFGLNSEFFKKQNYHDMYYEGTVNSLI